MCVRQVGCGSPYMPTTLIATRPRKVTSGDANSVVNICILYRNIFNVDVVNIKIS